MRRGYFPTRGGFTLVECLVTMTVMAILVVLVTQLCNSVQWIQCQGNRHLDADEEARAVFDRMAIDFTAMIRRPDADFWLKDEVNPLAGNDQLAFFSHVPGYYPEDSWNSPVSVVSYQIGSGGGLQRYSCGLLWNGMDRSEPQMIFSGSSSSSNASGVNTLACHWPEALQGEDTSNNEPAGPNVFRVEYYYVIRSSGTQPPVLSAVPWDARLGHSSVDGMCDVAALGVVIALIDAKSRVLISGTVLRDLAASMSDFSASATGSPGALEARWQAEVKAAKLPRAVTSSIRIYRRWFYLSPSPLHDL